MDSFCLEAFHPGIDGYMGHFGLLPNFLGGKTDGLQENSTASHTKSVALAFAKALF